MKNKWWFTNNYYHGIKRLRNKTVFLQINFFLIRCYIISPISERRGLKYSSNITDVQKDFKIHSSDSNTFIKIVSNSKIPLPWPIFVHLHMIYNMIFTSRYKSFQNNIFKYEKYSHKRWWYGRFEWHFHWFDNQQLNGLCRLD